MAITTLCAVVAALRVIPNRSQFFQYESVYLSCEQQGDSCDWRIKRNTSVQIIKEFASWTERNESDFLIDDLYPLDSGLYWCESAAGECSEAVSITVVGGSVILESPVLPVTEGESVTLRCISRMTSSSNLTADFYKDGRLIGSSSTGNMTIHSVSESDEGFYKCNISGDGGSPDSWLKVKGRPGRSDSPGAHFLLPVVVGCLSLVALLSVMLLCLWRRCKGKVKSAVSYTDVTITPMVQPRRITDLESPSTFYSTLKPEYT